MDAYRSGRSRREIGHPLLLLTALCSSIALSGCSFSIPPLAGGGSTAAETTGSIPKPVEMRLSSDLGQEDWRRAKAALGVALDPQGNGRTVKWDNPDTKFAGEITPLGPPFVEHDEICRLFKATIDGPASPPARREGRACKLSADEWVIKQVADPK